MFSRQEIPTSRPSKPLCEKGVWGAEEKSLTNHDEQTAFAERKVRPVDIGSRRSIRVWSDVQGLFRFLSRTGAQRVEEIDRVAKMYC